jgi:hypothetical protein
MAGWRDGECREPARSISGRSVAWLLLHRLRRAAAFGVTFVDFGWRRPKSMLSPILCFIQHWKRYERVIPSGTSVCYVVAIHDAEELSFYGMPRNDSRRRLESTSDTLGRSHK